MTMPAKAYMNWSSGKDSALCLHRVLEAGSFHVGSLLTTINATRNRIAMHEVRRELLEAQAAAIGLPLTTIELPEQPAMDIYEKAMREKISSLKKNGYDHAIFGDIFLEDLRTYREGSLQPMEINAVFPLWKIPSAQLIREFLDLGFRAIVVCVDSRWLDRSFCGRWIDESFVRDLPDNVDPCGENGEFHTFVTDGPIFKYPVAVKPGGISYKEYRGPAPGEPAGFYFCDLLSF